MNLLDSSTSTLGWLLINLPMSAGLGSLYSSLAMATQVSVEARTECSDTERMKIKAMAAGLNPFFRALGQSLGIAVGQAVFSNEMSRRYRISQTSDLVTLIEVNRTNPPPELTAALVGSLRIVWWILCALAGTALFMSIFTSDVGFAATEGAKRKEPVQAVAMIDPPSAHGSTRIDGTTLNVPHNVDIEAQNSVPSRPAPITRKDLARRQGMLPRG